MMLRSFSRICPVAVRYVCPQGNELFVVRASLLRGAFAEGRRGLFTEEYLGIENYKRERLETAERFGNSKGNFICRMTEYMKSSESVTIFTDDLKSALCLADSDADIDVAVSMARRFHARNLELRFSEFVFGPPIMRMLYTKNRPDVAYELYMDESLTGLFKQVSSSLVLMDLLYNNEQYDKVLHVMDAVIEKQSELGGEKYPVACVTLAAAACHKLNTAESLDKALSLVKELIRVPLRVMAFTAMLALTQKKPSVAHELVSSFQTTNLHHTPVTLINVKALTFAALGRADDAIQTLRVVIEQDVPDHVRRRDEVFQEVLTAVGDVSREFGNKEAQRQFAMTEKALRDGGFVTQRSLAEMLDEPIMRTRRAQDGYKHRPRQPVMGFSRPPVEKTYYRRPGLLD